MKIDEICTLGETPAVRRNGGLFAGAHRCGRACRWHKAGYEEMAASLEGLAVADARAGYWGGAPRVGADLELVASARALAIADGE